MCKISGCKRAVYARGLCRSHYRRVGRAEGWLKQYESSSPCSIEGCGKPSDSHGLCKLHGNRRRRHGDPLFITRASPQAPGTCTYPGCGNPRDSYGLCRGHRVRQIKHGDPAYVVPSRPDCAKCGGPRVGRDRTKELCSKCYKRSYLEANRGRHRAYTNMRRKRVQQATPPWADKAAIVRFYEGCPPGHEVDHVLPLKGRTVSGLHVEANLQYLPMPENRRKGASLNL